MVKLWTVNPSSAGSSPASPAMGESGIDSADEIGGTLGFESRLLHQFYTVTMRVLTCKNYVTK